MTEINTTQEANVREAETRLREWSQDDIHLLQSVRMHEPTYRNPSRLRADVRALLADRDRLAGEVDRYEAILRLIPPNTVRIALSALSDSKEETK